MIYIPGGVGNGGPEYCAKCYKLLFPAEVAAMGRRVVETCRECKGHGRVTRWEGKCYKCGHNHDPADKWCPYDQGSIGDDF
jgi:hypothetical protein